MKKQKFFIIFLFGSIVFAVGLFFGLNSWQKNLYVEWTPKQGRRIAGTTKPNILNISYESLTQKASTILFSQTKTLKENNLLKFYLGNFLMNNLTTESRDFICEVFSYVEFTFTAIGVVLSGEEGLMIVQSPCLTEDENFIGPFFLPYKEILTKPSKKSFELSEKETFIRFYNASTLLTPSWLLKSVRFFNEDQEDTNFLVQFTPGKNAPYFKLTLKNEKDIL